MKIFGTLPKLTALKISGADAGKFLQGQFTADILGLAQDAGTLSAYCNQKGRVLIVFAIFSCADAYYLLLPTQLAKPLQARLKQFAFMAKVEITDLSVSHSVALLADAASSSHYQARAEATGLIFQLPWLAQPIVLVEIAALGTPDLAATEQAEQQWLEACFAAAIPWLGQEHGGKYLVHPLNLIELNAVSFNKGCYVGQEIIARTQYRGRAKKHLQRAKIDGVGADAIACGDTLRGETGAAGEVVIAFPTSATSSALLVLLADTMLDQSIVLEKHGAALELLPMPFAVNITKA